MLSTLNLSLLRTAGIIQEKNSIVNNVVDEILLHETQKVSYAREASEYFGSDYDENKVYQVEMMIL